MRALWLAMVIAMGAPAARAEVPVPGAAVEAIAGGTHWRFESDRGPVHVWAPPGYAEDTAGVVVYVHGYYTDVDQAWQEHGLAAQFAASGRNALFIVPEAPVRGSDPLLWTALDELVRTVRQRTGLRRPWGPVVVAGHSGAYRTIIPWLEDPGIEAVILLDALYGAQEQFAAWLERPRRRPGRLIVIGADTVRWTEPWCRSVEGAVVLERIPERLADVPPAAAAAPLVYMLSQHGHMEIVTQGRVIPLALRLSGLPDTTAP